MTVTARPPVLRQAGSAAPWLIDLVSGPVASAEVLHSGRDAVYLAVGATCVGVLGTRAVLVPCGIRTSLPALPTFPAGCEALLGAGKVVLPGLHVVVAGAVGTGVGTMTTDGVRRAGVRAAGLADGWPDLEQLRTALPDAALRHLVAGDPAAVRALVGRGPGLTPLGDDVLSGWLATAWATAAPALEHVSPEVLSCAEARTTTLSATLLRCAAHGEAPPQVRDLLRSLADPRADTSARSLDRLLAVGGSSGAGLALGCLAALGSLPGTRRGTPR